MDESDRELIRVARGDVDEDEKPAPEKSHKERKRSTEGIGWISLARLLLLSACSPNQLSERHPDKRKKKVWSPVNASIHVIESTQFYLDLQRLKVLLLVEPRGLCDH